MKTNGNACCLMFFPGEYEFVFEKMAAQVWLIWLWAKGPSALLAT
jgi:hypothetical protein